MKTIKLPKYGVLCSLLVFAFFKSTHGMYIASGSDDNIVRIWNIKSSRLIKELKGHTAPISSVFFSKNGKKVISSSWDRTVRVWNLKTGTHKKFQTDGITGISLSPDGKKFARSKGEEISLFATQTGDKLSTLKEHLGNVTTTSFSFDGEKIASASHDETIIIWSVKTKDKLKVLEGHTCWVNAVAFSPHGEKLVSGGNDRTVRMWDFQTGKQLNILNGHMDSVASVAYSPNGEKVVSGSYDKRVIIWKAKTGDKLQTLNAADVVNAITFSIDGKKLAFGAGNEIRIRHVKTGTFKTLKIPKAIVIAVAFSPVVIDKKKEERLAFLGQKCEILRFKQSRNQLVAKGCILW